MANRWHKYTDQQVSDFLTAQPSVDAQVFTIFACVVVGIVLLIVVGGFLSHLADKRSAKTN